MNKCLDQEEGESLTFGDIQISLRSMDMYLVMGSVEESYAQGLVTESLENVHYILKPSRAKLTLDLGTYMKMKLKMYRSNS